MTEKLLPTTKLLVFSNSDGSYIGWNTLANVLPSWKAAGKSDDEIKDMVQTLRERGWVASHETRGSSVVVERYLDWDLRHMVREGDLSFEAVALLLKP